MEEIIVVNLNCGGCANTIKTTLIKEGYQNVLVDIKTRIIKFKGDKEKAIKLLTKMGYPEEGSPEADSILKKAKSYVSCVIGKVN